MALIICPECGKTISDKAAACIGCGCPVSEMNMETVQPAGRAQRRRRYQPEVQETAAETQAKPAFDPAAFDAVMQTFFTEDVPIKLQTPAQPAQNREAAQKAEAIRRLAQVASMAAAQQAAEAKPVQGSASVQQMPMTAVQATPATRKAASARPAPVNTNPANSGQMAVSRMQMAAVAPAPVQQPAPRPAPAGTVPVSGGAPNTPTAGKSAVVAPVQPTAPRPAPAGTAPVSSGVPNTPTAGKPTAVAPAKQSSPDPAPTKAKKGKGKKAKAASSQSEEQTAFAPDNTVPSEMPEYGIFFGTFMTLLREGIGVLSYAAVAAVVATVVNLLSGGGGIYVEPEVLLGLLGGYALASLVVNLDFLRARRFLRKGGYLDAIRNDGPMMTNCVNAYKLYPSRAMIWYIKRLNPAHGAKIAQWAKEGEQERRKARLRYLVYALVLAVVFYCLPQYEMIFPLLYLMPLQILLIEHLITLVVVILYAEKNSPDLDKLNLEVLIVFAGVFALMLYVHDLGDLWYHIIINAVVVFVAFIIGGIWHDKRKK